MANRWGNNGNSGKLLFSWTLKSLQVVTATMKLKDTCSFEEMLWQNLDSILKSRDITLSTNVHLVEAMFFFFSSHVWMWELDHKNWHFWTVLKKTLGSPLGCKEIKSINPKGNQPWTDAEAEALILWPLDVKRWLIRKAPDAGKDWGQEEKGPTEDEMVGWHHRLDGCGFEQALGDGDGQGGLACCSPWGFKESTRWSDWTAIATPLFCVLSFPQHRRSACVVICTPTSVFFALECSVACPTPRPLT